MNQRERRCESLEQVVTKVYVANELWRDVMEERGRAGEDETKTS